MKSNRARYIAGGGMAALVAALVTVAAGRSMPSVAAFEEDPHQSAATVTAQPNAGQAASSQAVLAGGRVTYADVVDKVAPGVVTVRVEGKAAPMPTSSQLPPELGELFGRQFRFQQPRGRTRGLGSGVVVSQDGYILTNNHVIDEADQIRVEMPDKRVFTAKLVGTDPATDLAVLKIEAKSLATVSLGNSDRVRVGDVVLAVGNPLNLGQTVTMGIVSAKGRATGLGDGAFEDFLQTDAPINQGNSGGALVNMHGELVGINSQILSPSGGNIGVGFAIPVNMAHSVMDQLIKDGKVHRAKLGVTIQNVTPDLATSMGLIDMKGGLVSNVEAGSPAARAGIHEGDVIVEVDGRSVSDNNELRNVIAGTRPGTTVALKVLRDGKSETMRATLGELAPASKDARGGDATDGDGEDGGVTFGLNAEPLTPALADRLELPRTTRGVVVTDVDPSGEAAAGGLQQGDVIQKVNGKDVTTVAELRLALRATLADKPALVLAKRGAQTMFLTVRKPEAAKR
jgi:Do/DeqQ family serine protease